MANTYYASNAGSSGNSGLSQLLPKDTMTHALAAGTTGDTFLGNGGDVFREIIQFNHATITIGAYGTGKPTATGANVMTGWAPAGVGTNTFSMALTTSPNMVFSGATRLTKGGSSSTLTNGQWFWVSNVLYVRWDAGNPDTVGLVIEASVRNYGIDTNSQNNWTVDSWIVQRANADESGLYAHFQPVGWLINNSEFYDNYGQGVHINGVSAGGKCQHSIFQRNGLDAFWYSHNPNINQFFVWNQMSDNAWRDDGAADFSGGVRGSVQSGEWAFNKASANGSGSTLLDGEAHGYYLTIDVLNGALAIHHNESSGHTKGDGFKADSSCKMSWNYSHENTWQGFELGFNATNSIVIIGDHNFAWLNGKSGVSIQHGSSGAGTLTVKLYNTTCYQNCQIGQEEVTFFTDVAAFEMKNAILFSKSGGSYIGVHATITGTFTTDYNDFFNGSSTPFRWNNGSPISFATWKSTTGQDAHSLTVDPVFVSVP